MPPNNENLCGMSVNSLPLVSAVIPTYNRGAEIIAAIQSALNQTYPAIEVIVIDDGSTDGTADILTPYTKHIRYIYQERGERARARNRGIESANGDYVAFLDSDDLWLPNKIALQVDALHHNPSWAWCFCQAWMVNSLGQPITIMDGNSHHPWQDGNADIFSDLLFGCFIPSPSSVLVIKSALEQVGGFATAMIPSEDWHLWLRLALNYPGGRVAQPLLHYQAPLVSVPATYAGYRFGETALHLLQDVLDSASEARCSVLTRQRAIAYTLWLAALVEYALGNKGSGQEYLSRALSQYPGWVDEPHTLVESLAGFANHLYHNTPTPVTESLALVRQVTADLPANGTAWQRWATGLVYAGRAWIAHVTGDRHGMRGYSALALQHTPELRRNLGLWSVCAEGYLGPVAMAKIREMVRIL